MFEKSSAQKKVWRCGAHAFLMELRTANGPVPNVEFGELRPERVRTQWTTDMGENQSIFVNLVPQNGCFETHRHQTEVMRI